MAENDEFDEENEDETNAPKDLRKQLSKAHKDNQSLQDRLAELERSQRDRNVSDYLSSKGLNVKVAKLLPANISDPTEIDNFLTEYADVFGSKTDASDETPTEPEDDGISDETKTAHQRVADATAGGESQGAAQDILARIQGMSADESPDVLKTLLAGASLS